MNPSYTNDPNRPDVVLGLSKPHLAEMMQQFVGKYIDYTAKIISIQNGTVSAIFADYDIYQRPEVPPQLAAELKANAMPATRLKMDLGQEPLCWFDVLKDTYPATIQRMFSYFQQKPAQITCEIVQRKESKVFYAKLNPAGASDLEAQYDIEVQLGPTTPAPPMLKPGVVVTVVGEFFKIDMNCLMVFHGKQVQMLPGQKLSALKSTPTAQIAFNNQMVGNINKWKQFSTAQSTYVQQFQRGVSSPSTSHTGQTPVIRPPVIKPIGVPVIKSPSTSVPRIN